MAIRPGSIVSRAQPSSVVDRDASYSHCAVALIASRLPWSPRAHPSVSIVQTKGSCVCRERFHALRLMRIYHFAEFDLVHLPRLLFVLMLAGCAGSARLPDAVDGERAMVRQLISNTRHGKIVFQQCIACHRSDGSGNAVGAVPVIAGQTRAVLIKQLEDYRHSMRWDALMEAVANQHNLTELQDINDVSEYLSRLPFKSSSGHGAGTEVDHGAEIYVRLCMSCHSARGAGNSAQEVPRLAGQHYEYLRRQILAAIDGRRPAYGDAHVTLLKSLVSKDIDGVSDFLSRQSPGVP